MSEVSKMIEQVVRNTEDHILDRYGIEPRINDDANAYMVNEIQSELKKMIEGLDTSFVCEGSRGFVSVLDLEKLFGEVEGE